MAKKKKAAAKKKAAPAKKKPTPAPAKKKKPAPAPAKKKKPAPARARAKKRPNAAAELIEVEQALTSGSTDPKLRERWTRLVTKVLGDEEGPHTRRSLRLPAGVPVKLGIRQGEFVCQLTDLSHLGITVTGGVLPYVVVGESVELRAIVEDGEERAVGVRCEVVRLDTTSTPATAGLSLVGVTDEAVQRRYFDAVYYPLYLAYLKTRAKT